MNAELGNYKHVRSFSEQRKEKVKDLKGNFHVHGFQKHEFYGLTMILNFYEPKCTQLSLSPILFFFK